MAQLKYNVVRVEFIVNKKPCSIDLGGLEYHFGFDERILRHATNGRQVYIAQRPPDMTRGIRHFFIYCSLVKGVTINEQVLPLLASIDATKDTYGQQIMHPVQHPLFVECVEGPQQLIEVTIADDTGNVRGLLMGRTKLTLAIQ